jgi:hypothetical protein
MRWVRKNATFGAISALFALAVQLVLSFGHVHLDGFGRDLTDEAGSARLALEAPAALPDTPVLPTQPVHPKSNGAPGDFCAICVVTQLAGALVPAAAPALPLPAMAVTAPPPIAAGRALAAAPPVPFQARGPPLS